MEEEEPRVELHRFDEQVCTEQIGRLERVRAERNEAEVKEALQKVAAEAKAGGNVMPGVVEAVKAYATVGELTNCLVEVYGRYEEPIRF